MPERGVEDFSFAELFAPGNGIMASFFGVRMLIQIEKLVDGRGIVALDDVNLLVPAANVVGRPKMFGRWVLWILYDAFDFFLRAMCLKFTSEHFNIGTIAMKRVARAMSSHKCMALPNPIDEPIAIEQRQVTSGVRKNNNVIILQRGGREFHQRLLQLCIPCGARDFIFCFEL